MLTAAGRAMRVGRVQAPLILGGDLNLRPAETNDLRDPRGTRHGLARRHGPDALDHLLARGLSRRRQAEQWSPERREVRTQGLAIRLSDHAPVEARFAT